MRHLKIFEEYRKGSGQLPIQKINLDEFKRLLNSKCLQFLKVVNKINFNNYSEYDAPPELIFRKFKSNHGNYLLTDPKESEHRRIAPWSSYGNWHNLFVSNLSSWEKYPRRNKSIITAGWKRARSHGGSDMYLVIPFDSTMIGVCRGCEFWEAFNVEDYIPSWINSLISKLSIITGKDFTNDDSWEDIHPYLDRKYDKSLFNGYDINKTLLDNLNHFLDPKINKFSLGTFTKVSNLEKESCRECWFEDEAILIDWKYLINLSVEERKSVFSLNI